MTQKEKNIATIVFAVAILIFFFTWSIIDNFIEAKKEQEESMKTVLVTDAGRYFTVIGCAKKFISYVQNGTNEDILLILNDEYKTSNGILESNLRNYVPSLSKDIIYDYVGKEMYQHRISKNVVEYYVKGSIKGTVLDEPSTYVNYDLTIILYENEFLFSVRPGIGDLNL